MSRVNTFFEKNVKNCEVFYLFIPFVCKITPFVVTLYHDSVNYMYLSVVILT